MPSFRSLFPPVLQLLSLVLCVVPDHDLIGAEIVVAPQGDDGAAGSVASPLATLDAALARARPGDRILLRAGLHAPPRGSASGSEGAPITVAAYDGGEGPEAVLITGACVLDPAGWRQEGERFRHPLSGPPAFGLAWLVGDGDEAIYPEACWPNLHDAPRVRMPVDFAFADEVKTTVVTVDGKPGSRAVFSDRCELAGLPEECLVGALLQTMPPNLWVGHHLRVTANTGSDGVVRMTAEMPGLNVAKPLSSGVRFGSGSVFRVQGPKELLDRPGEWAIDGDSILFWPPAGLDPRTTALRLVAQDRWDLGEAKHLIIQDLACEGLGLVLPETSRSCRLLRLRLGTIPGVGCPGIVLGGQDHRVEDCDIAWVDSAGIACQPTSAASVVRNCTIIGTGRLQGLGISLQGPGHLIEQCTVRGAATHGIGLGPGSVGTRILRCDVSFAGMLQSDIAGINSFDAGHFENAEIAFNRVHDIVAVTREDVPKGESGGWNGGMGIRIDNGTPIRGHASSGIRIHHNLVWNCSDHKAIVTWALGKGAQGYDDAKILIAHNSVADGIWLTAVNLERPASWRGIRVLNNAIELGRIKGNTQAVAVDLRGSSLKELTIDANVVVPHGTFFPGWKQGDFRPIGPGADQLKDTALPIADLAHQTAGAAPDIGALEAGQEPWIAGALLRPCDLRRVRVSAENGAGLLTGLPLGRSFPTGSRVRLSGGSEVPIVPVYDDATGCHRGRFSPAASEVEVVLLGP